MALPRTLLIAAACLGLAACEKGSALKQWIDPDKTFATLAQPDVEGVNATLEKQAQASLDQGDLTRAAQFYEQLLGTKKGTPAEILRYKLGYAECLRRSGQNDKALGAYDELLKDNPDNLDVQEGRGLTLMALGKSTDAGRVFQDIMAKDGKRWRTLNALGILFVNKDMIPEAMAYYTEALKYSPDNPAILNNVGLSQAVDKNYSRATQALEQASRVAKSGERRKQVDLNLALVYATSGDVDTAKEIAEKYFQGPALDNNVGLYAHLAKDDSLAKTYLDMALTDNQTYYERAWTNRDLLEKNGDNDDAPAKKK